MGLNKYGNKKINGFDSIKEFNRYQELKLLERAGKISGLTTQVPFELIPKQYDDNGKFLKSQTETLRKDILSAARNGAYLELLYSKHLPEENTWRTLLEEKLLLELVNLVLDVELPTDQTLNNAQIELAQKTFRQMLDNAS